MKSSAQEKHNLYSICITVVAILLLIAFLVLFFHAGYHTKILVKLGLAEPASAPNYALVAWENCLRKLNYDADVVFLGDSLTRASHFSAAFPECKIVNLGYTGDSLEGMKDRISMVQAVKPEKIFVMGGINGLKDTKWEQSLVEYNELITELKKAMPEAQIYIQSVLPIADYKESSICSNSTIVTFNAELQKTAQEQGLIYIDLYALYEQDGQLNPALTTDGLHLLPEAYSLWADAIAPFLVQE